LVMLPSAFLFARTVALSLVLSTVSAHYSRGANTYFHPSDSSTFELVKLGNVNVTFLDETNLLGYDGADFVEVGGYSVKTRLGLIQECNSANFNNVDGILGFGWANNTRTAALLRTLTTHARPHWNITQPASFTPMPRIFAFTASKDKGEVQLGGWDTNSVEGPMTWFPMVGNAYGANITSITYGLNGPELLHFSNPQGLPTGEEAPTGGEGHTNGPAYIGDFDSGTTCVLLPNTTVNGTFTKAPYQILLELENQGKKASLIYTIGGSKFEIPYSECVDAADTAMILGDAWFRKWVVVHDLLDLNAKRVGLGLLRQNYVVGASNAAQLTKVVSPWPSKLMAKRSLQLSATHALTAVRKVPLRTQSYVTYTIELSIGTPRQPLEVIFDTGSYMLAVFSDAPPSGMTPTGLLSVSTSSALAVSSVPQALISSITPDAAALVALGSFFALAAVLRFRRPPFRGLAAPRPDYGSLATTV